MSEFAGSHVIVGIVSSLVTLIWTWVVMSIVREKRLDWLVSRMRWIAAPDNLLGKGAALSALLQYVDDERVAGSYYRILEATAEPEGRPQ